jgi:tagatose 6-phosphate kinase
MYCWLNTFVAGQVNIPFQEERFPGGKGVHVALAIAELGEPVVLLGCWGGPTGQWIKKECVAQGIICYGPEVDGWTRTCISFKGEASIDDTELLGIGPTISEVDFENFIKTYVRLVATADVVTMSGSWPKGAPIDAYAQLINLAHKAEKDVILDCAGEQLNQALKQKPFAVHINRYEGENLFQEESPEKIATLLAENCENAAVTAGAAGLYLATPNQFIRASCSLDKVFSAVGSGDCLVAGLAVAYKRGLPAAEVARLAVACGSANCLRPDLGMLHRSDVEILQQQVIINIQEKETVPLKHCRP